MAPTLNIIGCGQVGKVLGRLWTEHGTFQVQDVLNRSSESATHAIEFLGAGRATPGWDDLHPADVFLIGTPDDQVEPTCARLAESGLLRPGDVVFHCSGALPSTALASAKTRGAATASVHPIRSFAGADAVARAFVGTYCGMEGDAAALGVLGPAFSAIGARLVTIDPRFKTIYHSAAVFSSNYLVSLLDVAVEAYAKAGVPRDEALRLMEPLVRGTVDNVFRLGTTEALTGPIARGDVATVLRQYRALSGWDKRIGALYKRLGKFTAAIAARKRRQN
ncbi:Rossmann-like and DUF2520 domain-containing protein [Noviherbaspirillum denitrificans]|uniref:Oxidoreductase n=1 Tax=Noviherbaspirillum denitrificans TaxID=1968433 RepID=A0A254TLE8_9BURK|nr:Rossmann-like and DUF2520 domain-containing protein [Noviherbaspirillum denitrificans]OWW23047.1 oxidoreductase [Noviherbaspirillum denitrificans]